MCRTIGHAGVLVIPPTTRSPAQPAMYIPKHFEQPDVRALHDLVRAAPLATLVVPSDAGLVANHIPFVLEASNTVKLLAHIPRANPLSELATTPRDSLAIFHGPQGYVSPSWYATKREHGKVVPSWNYAVVHAHGRLRVIDDVDWVLWQVDLLTQQNEGPRAEPWAVSDAPAEYTERLARALVGLEIQVERLEGKSKASQNQPTENQQSVLAGLEAEAPDSDFTHYMQAALGAVEGSQDS